jgi:hypothetical protein
MSKIFTRVIPLAALGMSVGLLWDAWWHLAVGRDQFWIPPHLTLYLCLAVLLVVSFTAWRKTKVSAFRALFFITLLFPLTGVLDELWHEIFGVENLISPIVVWSPPHLLILASLIAFTLYARQIVAYEEDSTLKWFMHSTLFASFLGFLLIFVMPFFPLGSYHVIGYWGAGIIMFVYAAVTLYIGKNIPQTGTVILVTIIFMMLLVIGPPGAAHPAPGLIINPSPHIPPWVFIYSFIVPALFLEIAYRWNAIAKGAVAGLLGGAIFYFAARFFIDMQYFYGIREIAIALFSSTVGGFLAGLFAQKFYPAHKRKELK